MQSDRALKKTPYAITDLMFMQGFKDVNPYI
jgi:hypothetical protein